MLRIHFHKSIASDGYDIYAHRYSGNRRVPYKITLEAMKELSQAEYAEPSCHFAQLESQEVIRALLEGLAEAGLIPRMGATEAELKATTKHLQDMRALVFKVPSLPVKET